MRPASRPAAIIKRVRAGLPAVEPKAETFGAVAANWLKRHVDANGLLSSREIERLLDVHVLPVWGDREFTAIRRSDVAALLDERRGRSQRTAGRLRARTSCARS